MLRLLEALRSKRTDEGFSLVEVVVATVILGLLSTGIAAGTTVVTRMTADNRARQIAVNLAEAKLDEDRGILDPTRIYASTETRDVSGRTFTITQTASLIGADGAAVTCGSGSTLFYRQITVKVTWTGMLPTTTPVRSDTIIAPNGRINDASTGSISVLVTGSAGTGEADVAVTVTPVSGTASALQSQPDPTGPDGCAYATGVTPGTYKVAISRTGAVNTRQVANPSNSSVVVPAGATVPVSFTYDDAAMYTLTYDAAGTIIPSTMPVTFLTASGPPYITRSTSAPPSSVSLFPYPAGYTAVAGAEADANGNTLCAAEDPAAWPGGTYGGVKVQVGVRGAAAAPPGQTKPLTVPMGTFTVEKVKGQYITAVAQNAASTTTGQPDCAAADGGDLVFAFPQITTDTKVKLSLPYGTYQLYSSTSSSGLTALLGGLLNLVTSTTKLGIDDPAGTPLSSVTSTATSNVLVLDPRRKA